MAAERNTNIDLVKGVLIIFVIIGHAVQGSLDSNLLRHVIYSFHMPIFAGISGYLININRVASLNTHTVWRGFLRRFVLSWLVAVVVYQIYNICLYMHQGVTLCDIATKVAWGVITPFYHLWYIPGYISWVFGYVALSRAKLDRRTVFAISVVVSILSLMFYTTDNKGLTYLLHTFRPQFFTFFVLGVVLRNSARARVGWRDYLIPALGLVLVVIDFYAKDYQLSNVLFFVFNYSLLSLLIKLCNGACRIRCRFVEWLGVNSLEVYLWHVIPILVCKTLYDSLEFAYYATLLPLYVLFFIAIIYTQRLKRLF